MYFSRNDCGPVLDALLINIYRNYSDIRLKLMTWKTSSDVENWRYIFKRVINIFEMK